MTTRLMSAIKVGSLELPNRTLMPAMQLNLTPTGEMTDEMVDFFVERSSGRVLVNEINTMPGFTSISMYPRLWETSGLPFAELLDQSTAFGSTGHTFTQVPHEVQRSSTMTGLGTV